MSHAIAAETAVTKNDPNATADAAQPVGGAGGEERSGKKQGTKPTRVLTATVLGRRRLGPSLIRLTLGGAGLEHLAYQGYDQWFRLFLPREGDGRMRLPAGDHDDGWYGQYQAATEDRRTWMRYATVADYRPSAAHGPGPGPGPGSGPGLGPGPELDVDVVVHGQPGDPGSGPLSTWAQTAAPGDRVALLDQGTIFRADNADQDVLLIGDETAVPAIAGILRRLAPVVRGRAFLEVPYAEDVQDVGDSSRVEVTWLPRHGVADVPGQRLLDAVRGHLQVNAVASLQRPGEPASPGSDTSALVPYVYAAGETKLTKALNHLLRQEYGWPNERLTVVGYWHFQGGGELR